MAGQEQEEDEEGQKQEGKKKEAPALGKVQAEFEAGGGVTVVDFDMLCATVAMQTHGFSSRRKEEEGEEEEEEEEGERGGGGVVQRMWEGDIVVDCLDDRRIAIETACCPCYRFGKNMRRASIGSCYLHVAVYSILIVSALFNIVAFGITKQHRYIYVAVASAISMGVYLGHFRTRIRNQFNIRGSDSSLDDCIYHLICPCCTLCQESRTLEMNNVHDGFWHGRGDAICLGSCGEGSKAFIALHKPPLMPTRSPDLCNMERVSNGSEHSWNADSMQLQPLVP